MDTLASTEWLAKHLNDEDIAILDCSWHMPAEKRNAEEEFYASHIAGARFFNIETCCDKSSPLPHTLPNMHTFAEYAAQLGIRNEDRVVVYDTSGLFSAARAWYMFRLFGHQNVAILNGGFPAWTREQRATEHTPPAAVKPSDYQATQQPELCTTKEGIKHCISSACQDDTVIVDARGAARFSGAEAEPRAGLRSGHIPSSINIPYKLLLTEDGFFKPDNEIKTLFSRYGISPDSRVITSCGSGVTAAILAFGLDRIGNRNYCLYDGSWAEWGPESGDDVNERPVATLVNAA